MIGLRDWEVVKPGKLPKCDLLEVYSRDQIGELKQLKEMKLITENVEEIEGIEFTNEEEMEDYVVENVKVGSSNSNLKTKLQEDEFDWDDI